MLKIKLHGKDAMGAYEYAYIDDKYYDWLNRYYWVAKPDDKGFIYAVADIWTPVGKKMFRMHRFIMNAPGTKLVDHVDGDTVNNQEDNLRLATRTENGQNVHKSSRYKGCSYDGRTKVWWGRIKVNGKQLGLGCYDTELDCAVAYNHAAKKYFGKFASYNNVPGWENLTPKQHIKRSYIYKSNTSGVPGVTWHKLKKCWYVSIGLKRIGIDGSPKRGSVYIGLFKDRLEAIEARRDAEIKYLGKSDINLDDFKV